MKRYVLTGLLALAACSPNKDAAPASKAMSARWVADSTTASTGAAVGHTLDCTHPVALRTSAAQVIQQYGAAAVAGDLSGPEGTRFKGVTLYPGTAADQLELSWWDDAQTAMSMARARDHGAAWTGPGALHVGSTLAEVEAANGKPFDISGFGWDYGGYAVDLKGGKLTGLPDGCVLQLRFDNPNFTGNMPEGISGDGVTVSSNDPRLKKFAPVVTEMSVGWPLPDGVKPSADDGGGD